MTNLSMEMRGRCATLGKIFKLLTISFAISGPTNSTTSWTIEVQDSGKKYDVVIVGSPNVNPGYKLVNNATYPQIASDYEKTFTVLRSLHCDVFLGAHGSYYDMEAKYGRRTGGTNPFIDAQSYQA